MGEFESRFSEIINTRKPKDAIKILLPIVNELRYQAEHTEEINQKLSLTIKQMELDKKQLELDYDKLLMRIKTVSE